MPETHNGYTLYNDVDAFCNYVLRRTAKKYVKEKQQKFIRVCCGFDIETTRIETYAFMYHWQFSFDRSVLTGRTWAEYEHLIERLQTWLKWQKSTLIVWVANLGHEFAFIGRRFVWQEIFATDSHTPLKARSGHIEYRECLTISGAGGLANLAKNYTKTKKAKGDLDYTIPRNSQSVLDSTELGYCYADVEILSEWGDYMFTEYSDNGKQIPLTASGIVRNAIKKAAEETGEIEEIRAAVNTLYPDKDIYNFIMLFLFRGGYTHACAWWCMVPYENIIGADFTSSYPAAMLHDYYPMSPFIDCDLQTDGRRIIDEKIKTRCVWFIADFFGVEASTDHSIESKHKIISSEGAEYDNGRLRRAVHIRVALTELDYQIYEKFYVWESVTVLRAQCAFRGNLPGYFLKPLKKAYKTKSRLKRAGLDSTLEYVNAKAICNSFYGCTVTRLKYQVWKYNQGEPFVKNGRVIEPGDWYDESTTKAYEQLIKNQLLSPWWGIWVTAHARKHLLDTVHRIDAGQPEPCVLYCDTDSIYMVDSPRARKIIAQYNEVIAAENRKLDPEFADIGCFDWVGTTDDGEPLHYKFKTLGAKRYIKWDGKKAEVTVAGLPKQALPRKIVEPFAPAGEHYILFEDMKKKTGRLGFVSVEKLFEVFNDSMLLTCTESMKTRAAYSPGEYCMTVTDLQGHTEEMHEMSGVAIVPVEFTLKIDDVFKELLEKILNDRRKPL